MIFSDKIFLTDIEITELIKEKLFKIPMIGCSTAGEIFGEELHEFSFVINFIKFKHTKVKKVSVKLNKDLDSTAAGKLIVEKLKHPDLSHIFILSDGVNINGSRLVEGLNSKLPKNVTVSGGLAADNNNFLSTYVNNINNEFDTSIVSAIGFYGDKIKIKCNAFGGWSSFGIGRTVTKSIENKVYEIDGSPALELYKTYLGDKVKDLPSSALLFPISIQSKETDESWIRTIIGINENENTLTFAGNVPEGSSIKLMKASTNSLINASELGAQTSRFDEYNHADVTGLVIMVSCIGRKLVLKQLTEEEIESVVLNFNDKFKFTGFYSYGEISSEINSKSYLNKKIDILDRNDSILSGYASCNLYNQTMTITVITEI